MRFLSPFFLLAALTAPALALPGVKIDYERDIKPIVSDNCTQGHGADENHRQGGLRLDIPAEALKEHEGVHAIVPGKPDESDLIARVVTTDKDEIMPPPKSKKTLTAEQKEKLRQWVAEGAEYRNHWS